MIVCCGEALIDFFPVKTASGADAFQPFAGGSIYNVAIALARLGRPAGYLGGISEDFFGRMLLEGLKQSNVDLSFVVKSGRASTLAFVQMKNGQPQYAFVDEGSAGRMLNPEQIVAIPKAANALHFGSFSLINQPSAETLEQLAVREKTRRVISLDPNIRSTLVHDRDGYMQRLGRMISLAHIIKVSDEDLAWMHPGVDPQTIARQWLVDGATLVIVTRGENGATAYTRGHELVQDVIKVTVCDTVGAGDTFTAGLLASLDKQGILNQKDLPQISNEQLSDAMNLAAKAAAITVSRAGANPPWSYELV